MRSYSTSAALLLMGSIIAADAGATIIVSPPMPGVYGPYIVTDYELVSTRRLTRTQFEYTYKAAIHFPGLDEPQEDVVVHFKNSFEVPTENIVDGTLHFGRVAPGERKMSLDTFTIIHDRQATPLQPWMMLWDIEAPGWFSFDHVVLAENVLYFFDNTRQSLVRFDVAAQTWLAPRPLPAAVTFAVYAQASRRVYVADEAGRIRYIDLSAPEIAFADFGSTGGPVIGLVPVDERLISFEAIFPGWTTQRVYSASGELLNERADEREMRSPVLSSTNDTLFYFELPSIPVDPRNRTLGLVRQTLDPGSLEPLAVARDLAVYPEDTQLSLSPTGDFLVAGQSIVDAHSLESIGSLVEPQSGTRSSVEAIWLGRELLWSDLRSSGATAFVMNDRYRPYVKETIPGARHVQFFPLGEGWLWVASVGGARVIIKQFGYGADIDQDGVVNELDDFPTAAWKWKDADADGAPEEIVEGRGDSEELDRFPNNSLCFSPDHAYADEPSRCNMGPLIPTYRPDSVAGDDRDHVFLLDQAAHRIYRWSAKAWDHLPPIDVSKFQGGWKPSLKIQTMAVWSDLNALLVLYIDGCIDAIDLATSHKRTLSCEVAREFDTLVPVGKHLFIAKTDPDGPSPHFRVMDQYGAVVDEGSYVLAAQSQFSAVAEWPDGIPGVDFSRSPFPPPLIRSVGYDAFGGFRWVPQRGRIFLLGSNWLRWWEGSPPNRQLLSLPVDVDTGKVGELAIHSVEGEADFAALTAAPDGSRILHPSGKVYEIDGDIVQADLAAQITGAVWTDAGITAFHRDPEPHFVQRPISDYGRIEYININESQVLQWDADFNVITNVNSYAKSHAVLNSDVGPLWVYSRGNLPPGFTVLE